MARRKSSVAEVDQMELIPECSDESKKKLRRLLAKMETADAAKIEAKHKYDEAETAVIDFIRDEEKIMPDKDGTYRLRLDADETIEIGHGKSKVKVKRVSNAETPDDDEQEEEGEGDE